ncbi:pyridoxamine 5'-phosphate oxidase family protein [Bradyrhizobium erythrophlei]|nr:pyridoxamine 5'-phosphate oxidase family protein [Bradyrhizobium erythrophlei]
MKDDVSSPWHEGELTIQRSVGVAEQMDARGRIRLRKFLLEQHREFFPLLPFVVLGAVDPDGEVWATLRAGPPGFLTSPDPKILSFRLKRDVDDPADIGTNDGDSVGVLGIDLSTRRRNRLNGIIRRSDAESFSLEVIQSFGNCPRYIQRRNPILIRDIDARGKFPPQILSSLINGRAREIITQADTFFVASYIDAKDGSRQVDVSHRGGKPGFVRLDEDGTFTIPDFNGNLFFNTLGNFLINPKAGLLFVDFLTGDELQLTGEAKVLLGSPEITAFQGAERIWQFRARQVIYRPDGLPLRWSLEGGGASPNSLMTGDWHEAKKRLRASELPNSWRVFRVAHIKDETALVRSLELEPTDGGGLLRHLAGQHIPIRIQLAGSEVPLVRTYTLSVPPSENKYRISVKRDGIVSRYLHQLNVDDTIEVRAPAGGFTIDATQDRPAVLLAAGIGITPMLAMVRHLVDENARTQHVRQAWLFQSARRKDELAFSGEIAGTIGVSKGYAKYISVLSDPDAVAGKDADHVGRIDLALLKRVLPFDDYDFYLCGPSSFMQETYDGLRRLKIADERIHAEAFGPSSLRRSTDKPTSRSIEVPATDPTRVIFGESGKEARWHPGTGTLLELAEDRGLSPSYGCRSGNCGTCSVKILKGTVAYLMEPSFPVPVGEALICCSIPGQTPGEDPSLHLAV